ncbi:MAG: HK97 family phage prohead protease [Dehalococcoidia bacterium]|nr:HK97 family phage prohead protease [Dehalococcoidia bacterium]
MELERKSFTGIELKEDKPGVFTAKIATLNVIDKDQDVTLPGSFPQGKSILISAYQHESWMGALPVGKGTVKEVGNDVIVEGEFNLKTETGREHYETIKFAPELQEWSYGFRVTKRGEETEWNGQPVGRIIKGVDIFEASPVLRGAGIGTATLAIKTEGKKWLYSEEAEAALAAVKSFLDRTKSLADLRRKDGRDISDPNRERLEGLMKQLAVLEAEIKALLTKPEPVDNAAAQKLFGEFIRIESQIVGVN